MGAAMVALAEAIRLDRGLAAVHVNLGIALRRQGADRVAVPAFTEANRLRPGINTSRRCWAPAVAAVRSEPTSHFPALRGTRQRKADAQGEIDAIADDMRVVGSHRVTAVRRPRT